MSVGSRINSTISQVSNFLKNAGSSTLALGATIAASSALVGLFTNPFTAVGSLATMGLYNIGIPTMVLGGVSWLTGKLGEVVNGTQKNLVKNLT